MRVQLDRRQFLFRAGAGAGGLLLGGNVLAACGGDDSDSSSATTAAEGGGTKAAPASMTTVKNSLVWIKNVEFAGMWVAEQKGYYEEEGIKPEWIPGGPNTPPVETTVAGGAADMGTTGQFSALVESVMKGSDFVMFAANYQVSPGGILSLPDKPIRSAQDLGEPGLKIGMQGSSVTIDAVLRLNGIQPNYELVKVGFTPDPLVQGQCDAYTCYVTNQPLSLEEKGIEHVVVRYDEMGYIAYGNIFFAKRDYLEKNRDLMVGYLRATIKGWEENEVDPTVGAKYAVDDYGQDLGLSLDQQIAENEAQIVLTKGPLTERKGLFWIDKETVAGPMYDALKASGMSQLPDIDRFVDTSLLEDAYGGKTKLT